MAALPDEPPPIAAWVGQPPIRLTSYIPARDAEGKPRAPHPPQHAFLWLDCEEAFYGGAAGGGKSDALLMAALQYVDVPGYAALILRKHFTDLEKPGAIMDRAKLWLAGTDAKWNDNKHRFTFPSGAKLEFGHLQTSDAKYQYQGAEYQFIGIDELTQIDEDDYLYLGSRLRRPDIGPLAQVPIRQRGAANPGGRGHRWVKRRFIERLPRPDDPEDTPEKCAQRIFIPAKLQDNPSVDQAAYKQKLSALDPQTRAQLLNGDWNAREPGDWVFPIGLDEVMALGADYDQRLKDGRMSPPVGSELILAADYGVHTHMLLLWPLEAGGFWAVKEIVYEHQQGANVRHAAPKVASAIGDLGWQVHQMRFDASQPVLNEAFLERLRELIGPVKWTAIPFGKFKAPTIDYLKLLVANAMEHVRDGKPSVPVLAVSEKGCPVLADQLRGWHYVDVDAGRVDKHDDHGPDALIAGAAPTAAARRKPR